MKVTDVAVLARGGGGENGANSDADKPREIFFTFSHSMCCSTRISLSHLLFFVFSATFVFLCKICKTVFKNVQQKLLCRAYSSCCSSLAPRRWWTPWRNASSARQRSPPGTGPPDPRIRSTRRYHGLKFCFGGWGGGQNSNLGTYDLYSPAHNVLDTCISITRASGRGLGPGNRDFFGSFEMASSR